MPLRKLLPLLMSVPVALLQAPVGAQPVDRAVREQNRLQQSVQQTQSAVDTLDDETRAMLDEYLELTEESDGLRDYNAQLRRMIEVQRTELARFEVELDDVEELRRRLFPLLEEMVDVLDRLVEVDVPFLPEERRARVDTLRVMLDEPDLAPAEKFRRIMEAYQIEMEYAHTIEAYQGELEGPDGTRTVDFLRFGRVGLYYLSLDGTELGYWNAGERRWVSMAGAHRDDLERGIRIARKQLPPDLVPLPVPAPEPRRLAATEPSP